MPTNQKYKLLDTRMRKLLDFYISDSNQYVDLKPAEPEHYAGKLYKSIISQQLSVKAASTIWTRFENLVGDINNPADILNFSQDDIRAVGLSSSKAEYILNIAMQLNDRTISFEHLGELNDEKVIEELVKLKGIGRWSAEMFLIFTLGRPDVFSVGDLGLRNAIFLNYGINSKDLIAIENLSQKWSPNRSICCLALWHSLK